MLIWLVHEDPSCSLDYPIFSAAAVAALVASSPKSFLRSFAVVNMSFQNAHLSWLRPSCPFHNSPFLFNAFFHHSSTSSLRSSRNFKPAFRTHSAAAWTSDPDCFWDSKPSTKVK